MAAAAEQLPADLAAALGAPGPLLLITDTAATLATDAGPLLALAAKAQWAGDGRRVVWLALAQTKYHFAAVTRRVVRPRRAGSAHAVRVLTPLP